MNPRQARRERREAERKAKKLESKKNRLALPELVAPAEDHPEIQPRWNPDLEDEFPREEQIRNNMLADRRSLALGFPIPPPGPSPRLDSLVHPPNLRARVSKPSATEESEAEGSTATYLASQNEAGFVSQNASSRAEINRQNAQHSTGPTTPTGKLASSRNSTKHGLASGTIIIHGEDPAAFESLLNDLLEEHQPAHPTEALLIEEMAQSYWLSQRALRLQNTCFTDQGVDEKQLALFLRYGTTHQRAFHKALTALVKLKTAKGKASQVLRDSREDLGFVSQPQTTATADTGFVSQPATQPPSQPEFFRQNPPSEYRKELQAA